MSKEAMAKIRQAEEQAARTVAIAESEAANQRAAFRERGEAFCAQTEQTTQAEYAEKLRLMQKKADTLMEKKRLEAEEEAAEIMAYAHEHMSEAVEMIVWGLVKKCQ